MDDDFAQIRAGAERFQRKVRDIQAALSPVDFEWYPCGTLSNFIHLDRLLTGANRSIFSGKKRVLDVGCQDGELAFCLEAAGHEVTAIDHPTYSHNGMRGVQTLKGALGSSVRLLDIDLDRQFDLSPDSYDVAVALGLLYHL